MGKICIGCCALAAVVAALAAGPVFAAEGETGKISINAARWTCTLVKGTKRLKFTGDTDPVDVPAGSYKVQVYQIWAEADPAKRGGMIQGRGSRTIEVKAGETTALAVAGPLQAKVTTTQKGGKVAFSLQLIDAAGGTVQVSANASGKRPAPPKIDVIDASGKVVYTAALAYG